MKISKEVQQALRDGQPVVCLETTIISHGMPYPKNVETALAVEEIIRENGAIPATIGIIDGEAVVGMSKQQILEFGNREGIVKASRADLPIIYAKKLWASTTVSATMIIASQAGIEIFVTGGIGGVHRGYQETMDLSTDLEELAQTNVSVICSGAKSILDIPRTLEYLETKGVSVVGYQTDSFPSFFSSSSPYPLLYRVNDAHEVASIIKAKRDNHLVGAVLIANPVPMEHSLSHEYIEEVINLGLEKAQKNKISGKNVTPFLLNELNLISKGKTLATNIVLIKNNARVGALISVALAKLRKEGGTNGQ